MSGNGNGTMCSKETPQLASASSNGTGTGSGSGSDRPFKGAASSPPAPLGPIPEGDEYSNMTDEEVNINNSINININIDSPEY